MPSRGESRCVPAKGVFVGAVVERGNDWRWKDQDGKMKDQCFLYFIAHFPLCMCVHVFVCACVCACVRPCVHSCVHACVCVSCTCVHVQQCICRWKREYRESS